MATQLTFDFTVMDLRPLSYASEAVRAARRDRAKANTQEAAVQKATAKAALSKPRRCLSCLRMFSSSGPGNRRCSSCRGKDSWPWPAEFSLPNAAF